MSSPSAIVTFLHARLNEAEKRVRDAGESRIALAEVEANRQIVERAAAEIEGQDPPRASALFASGILLVLAQPYADHPDYPPGWRQ